MSIPDLDKRWSTRRTQIYARRVGTTAARLPELFAAPIIVAVATVRLAAIIAATATAVVPVPPLTLTEVFKRGDRATPWASYHS